MSDLPQSEVTGARDTLREQRSAFGLAVAASCFLHLSIAALLFVQLPRSMPKPDSEQPVMVDLVPPEEAKPPPKPQAALPTPPSIQPAFQFGQRDMGPRKAPRGNGAEDGSATEAARADKENDDPLSKPQEKIAQGELQVPAPATDGAAAVKIVNNTPEKPKLKEAKKLFSQAATGDLTATTAMAGVPRPVRAKRLCTSELQAQLVNLAPPYFPEILPAESLRDGTTIEIVDAAFLAERRWFGVSYRCEVDAEVTKVVSFAFHVGDPIPRSEWRRRGLPSQ